MVTMAAPYGNNHRLIDGHGNWGSETDNAAASRYTECRLTPYSEDVLLTDFQLCETRDNYDGSLKEPLRVEAKLPHVLIGGAEGIGVGYATNVPQHSLREVVTAAKALLTGKGNKAQPPTPDFPSGCQIIQDDGLAQYLLTGRGAIRQRALSTVTTVERDGRKANWDAITFTNLPYQVSTEKVGEEIKKLVDDGRISGIVSLSDETDRTGQRLVVYAKAGSGEAVRDALYANTRLDTGFAANNTVIHNMQPKQLAPLDIIRLWLEWRDERLVVKFTAEQATAEKRLHIVQGLLKAIKIIDKIIKLIRASSDSAEASQQLQTLGFSHEQAEAILRLRLSSLTGLDSGDLAAEAQALKLRLAELKTLIEDKETRDEYLSKELGAIATRHGNKRVCPLVEAPVLSKTVAAGSKKAVANTASVPKPRYLKVDKKNGVITQLKNLKGSNLLVENTDKVIVLGANGVVKRLPANHNAGSFDQPTPLLSFERESVMSGRTYLIVWSLGGSLFANSVQGEVLCKTTSKGKRFAPEGAEILYFGEGKYTHIFESKRKKPKVLTPSTVKSRPLNGPGNKIA